MDKEEAKKELQDLKVAIEELESKFPLKNPANTKTITALSMAIKALEQKSCNDCIYYQDDLDTCRHTEPCEMTAEEYRQRMIQAFHNADCGELIAVCVLPTEKEFEYLEWLLKNHYKKEPCEDAISRQAAIVRCKDCRKHNVSVGYKKDCCPLYEFRGISYGHEHDYQFCCFAERRTDERSD